MKTTILMLLVLMTGFVKAQDTIPNFTYDEYESVKQHPKFFGFTPLSKKTNKVNIAFGFGHVENRKIEIQTVNGLNLEINPAPAAGALVAFIMLMHLPDVISANKEKNKLLHSIDPDLVVENWIYSPNLKINGLNLSTGCFFTTTSMNGLNISLGNKFQNFNGLSITPLGTIADKQIGLSIGFYNAANNLKGSSIGVLNNAAELNGVHFGLVNFAKKNRGLQVGVFNKSKSKGFQVGVWNVNSKRKLPLINW
jgi:hypothetical protein